MFQYISFQVIFKLFSSYFQDIFKPSLGTVKGRAIRPVPWSSLRWAHWRAERSVNSLESLTWKIVKRHYDRKTMFDHETLVLILYAQMRKSLLHTSISHGERRTIPVWVLRTMLITLRRRMQKVRRLIRGRKWKEGGSVHDDGTRNYAGSKPSTQHLETVPVFDGRNRCFNSSVR